MSNSPMSFCISTWNNLEYLKIAVKSVRENSHFNNSPFIIHAENCEDGTDEWLEANHTEYNLDYYIEKNKEEDVRGIGGGINFCADKVQTEYIMFLHSDFYVTKNWDLELLKIFEENPNEKLWVNSYRIEPDMFGQIPAERCGEGAYSLRPGTVIVPKDMFGAYYDDFDSEEFDEWVELFKEANGDEQIPKGEGVSGLIRKRDWDEVGGNDALFAPASWEDMDLFLRMLQKGFKFIQPIQSVVWHFGARGSHRLEENDGKSSQRQMEAERRNQQKWLQKWGSLPTFDEFGMINGVK